MCSTLYARVGGIAGFTFGGRGFKEFVPRPVMMFRRKGVRVSSSPLRPPLPYVARPSLALNRRFKEPAGIVLYDGGSGMEASVLLGTANRWKQVFTTRLFSTGWTRPAFCPPLAFVYCFVSAQPRATAPGRRASPPSFLPNEGVSRYNIAAPRVRVRAPHHRSLRIFAGGCTGVVSDPSGDNIIYVRYYTEYKTNVKIYYHTRACVCVFFFW